jgi:hypothetical protein
VRIMFGPTRDEVAGGWKKLHNKKLYNLRLAEHVARMGEDKDCSRFW